MKRIFILAFLVIYVCSDLFADRPKVAVVLSGGGAKGMAHIGALKVMEEAGIPIDFILGTSIGSIIGGLYAIGYDAATIDSIARAQDWRQLLSDQVDRNELFFSEKEESEKFIFTISLDPREKKGGSAGLVHGQNIHNLLTELTIGYHDSTNFFEFPIPFCCIAANVVNKEEVILSKGNLVMAMQSSMAIPGFFVPITQDSSVYVDGGIVNNFPVDVAKELGADYVIGVDLQANLFKADKLNSFQGMFSQLINFMCMNKHEENKELTDIYIRPAIDEYSAASFNPEAVDTLIKRGESAARAQWDELIRLKELLGMEKTEKPDERKSYEKQESFFVRNIYITGVSERDKNWIRRSLRIKEGTVVTPERINKAISILYGTKRFTSVTYRISGEKVYDLEFILEENKNSQLNFGFRFDTEEMAALLLNSKLNILNNSSLSFTGRLSKNPYVRLDYSLESPLFRKLNFAYMFKYNDFNIYTEGRKTNGIVYHHHLGEIGYSDFLFRNFKLQLGLRYEYFNYEPTLYVDEHNVLEIKSKGFVSYYGLVQLETFNRRYYPTRGLSFNVSYSLYTDNFITYNGDSPFAALAADFKTVISLTNRFKVLPSVYGRVIIGSGEPFSYLNYVGGEVAGRYVPQQLAFNGIGHVELFDNSVLVGKITLRQRMGARHYLSLAGNFAMHHDNFFDILDGKYIWGGSIGYSYDLRTGPVDLTISMSDWTKKVGVYFNVGYYF